MAEDYKFHKPGIEHNVLRVAEVAVAQRRQFGWSEAEPHIPC